MFIIISVHFLSVTKSELQSVTLLVPPRFASVLDKNYKSIPLILSFTAFDSK